MSHFQIGRFALFTEIIRKKLNMSSILHFDFIVIGGGSGKIKIEL